MGWPSGMRSSSGWNAAKLTQLLRIAHEPYGVRPPCGRYTSAKLFGSKINQLQDLVTQETIRAYRKSENGVLRDGEFEIAVLLAPSMRQAGLIVTDRISRISEDFGDSLLAAPIDKDGWV